MEKPASAENDHEFFQHMKQTLLYHQYLLRDEVRNRLFYEALSKVVTSDSNVLDIGSGSGIWAVAAAKLCNHCHAEYQSWRSRNSSRNSSSASSEAAAGSNNNHLIDSKGPVNPIAAAASASEPALAGLGLAKGASVAASVPRDWNWSTF